MATKLNLLPWREMQQRELDRKLVFIGVGAAVFMLLLVFQAHLYLSNLIEVQTGRNTFLKGEISKVEKQIAEIKELKKQRQALISRMNVIYQLQGSRTQIVHVFEDFVRLLPEGIYFKSLSQKGAQLSIEGTAQSNARVSALMRNLDESNWFTSPTLDIINVKDEGTDRVSQFKLKIMQTDKSAKKGQAPAGKPGRK
jgi:type IV pilus assembly protein PilN